MAGLQGMDRNYAYTASKGALVYLASTASSFHTGDAILIDGGYAAF
jgi:hypothetical protein